LALVLALAGSAAAQSPNWLLSPSLGIGWMDTDPGGTDMSLSLDGKRHMQGTEWLGASAAFHGFLSGGTARNSPHEFFSLTPTYSRILMAQFGHIGITTGMGLYLLRENTNLTTCDRSPWGFNFGGSDADDCDLGPEPPDIWRNQLGLVVPVAAQVGVHILRVGVAFQTEAGGLFPLTEKPQVLPWVHFKLVGTLLL